METTPTVSRSRFESYRRAARIGDVHELTQIDLDGGECASYTGFIQKMVQDGLTQLLSYKRNCSGY